MDAQEVLSPESMIEFSPTQEDTGAGFAEIQVRLIPSSLKDFLSSFQE
jgi:hypothetical protein